MNNLTLYCNCFINCYNLHTQFNQKNLICGSSLLPLEIKQKLTEYNYLLDDTGDNISHLNPVVGDLTGLYWIWKNTNDEYVGTNQYRRFWNDDVTNSLLLEENTIYISKPIEFAPKSLSQQLVESHGIFGMHVLTRAAHLGKIPLNEEMVNSLYHLTGLSPCNMFFGHRDIFNKLCEVLFSIILEIYEGSKYALNDTGYQSRSLAFLSERILNVIYFYSTYFFGEKVKIKPVEWDLYVQSQ